MNPKVIAALSTTAKVWKKPKFTSMDEWIKKMVCIYTHTYTYTIEYYIAIQKNKMLPFKLHGWN